MKKTTLILIFIFNFIQLYSATTLNDLINIGLISEAQMNLFKNDNKLKKIDNSDKLSIYGKYSLENGTILEIIKDEKKINKEVGNGTKKVKTETKNNIIIKITINNETYESENNIKEYINNNCIEKNKNGYDFAKNLKTLGFYINGSIKLIERKLSEKEDIAIINSKTGDIKYKKIKKLKSQNKKPNENKIVYLDLINNNFQNINQIESFNDGLNENNQSQNNEKPNENKKKLLNINSKVFSIKNSEKWFNGNFKFVNDNEEYCYYFKPFDHKKGNRIDCYNKIFKIYIDFINKKIYFYRLPCCYSLAFTDEDEKEIYNKIKIIVEEINAIQAPANIKNNHERNNFLKDHIESFFNSKFLKKDFQIIHIPNDNNLRDHIKSYNNFLNGNNTFNNYQSQNYRSIKTIFYVRKDPENNNQSNSPFKQNTQSTNYSNNNSESNSPFKQNAESTNDFAKNIQQNNFSHKLEIFKQILDEKSNFYNSDESIFISEKK